MAYITVSGHVSLQRPRQALPEGTSCKQAIGLVSMHLPLYSRHAPQRRRAISLRSTAEGDQLSNARCGPKSRRCVVTVWQTTYDYEVSVKIKAFP